MGGERVVRGSGETAQASTAAWLARIAALDRTGPRLNSIIALNDQALADARGLDRTSQAARGRMHGVGVVLKDNIETAGDLPTTAGSLALRDNVARRDAHLVTRLREAGAVILGKTNLSEWANFRSTRSISGWSAVGGLTRNPHALDRSASGSSSGSAAAVAAGLAWASVGTETDGSITGPAAANGVVGLKPTLGLISRAGIVPLAPRQDTAGPMARTVADAARLLTVLAGSDRADPATRQADARRLDYAAALDPSALRGARLGVLSSLHGRSPATDAVFEAALATLEAAGATLVAAAEVDPGPLEEAEAFALRVEFRAAIETYLAVAPAAVAVRSLADLIAFNLAEPREMALFGQDILEQAALAPGLADPAYRRARAAARRLAGREGIDRMLREAGVEALVAPSGAPAGVIDLINGDAWLGSPSTLPAVAGYPHLTVPMGQASGLPVGMSLIGPAWSEARLLALGHAFEQVAPPRLEPAFPASSETLPEFSAACDPLR